MKNFYSLITKSGNFGDTQLPPPVKQWSKIRVAHQQGKPNNGGGPYLLFTPSSEALVEDPCSAAKRRQGDKGGGSFHRERSEGSDLN